MTVPNVVFIDTCIFDAAKYDYGSSAISSLCDAIAGSEVKLLLPDPTEREILRHLDKRADDAFNMLKKLLREGPFLRSWDKWDIDVARPLFSLTLRNVARREWQHFLGRFEVERLAYDDLPVQEIMEWYDKRRPPFGEGKKRKEFPDAFALMMLRQYADRTGASVAVVSGDSDMKKACERFTALMHFTSLPKFTEAFLSSDERMDKARALLDGSRTAVEEAIASEAELFDYYLEQISVDSIDVQATSVEIAGHSIISLGETGFSVAFEAYVTVYAEYEVSDVDPECGNYSYTGSAEGEFRATGTLKLEFPVDSGNECEAVQVAIESPREAIGIDVPGYDWADYYDDR